MRINRYVLDANLWVSYFITNNDQIPASIVVDHKITFYYCAELIVEIKRVFNFPHLNKYHINVDDAVNFIKQISVAFTLVQPIKSYIPEDKNDNYIIALALQNNSGFISSGDKHILSQKSYLETKYKKLKILTKAEFEKAFK